VLERKIFSQFLPLAPAVPGKVQAPLSKATEDFILFVEEVRKRNLDVLSGDAELAWGCCASRLHFVSHYSQSLLFTR